jgi:hypothetical protein
VHRELWAREVTRHASRAETEVVELEQEQEQELGGGVMDAASAERKQPNQPSMIRLFEVMAGRVRAGEPWREVIADYPDYFVLTQPVPLDIAAAIRAEALRRGTP